MEQLTHPNVAAMSSREIADLTGKRHSDVMRDIRKLVNLLDNQAERKFASGDYTFEEIIYQDVNGATRPEYMLSKKETLLLVSGYSPILRAKIIDRWEELERKNALDFTNPETVLKLAQNWADERRKRTEAEQLASHRGQMLLSAESTIKQQAPKVEYYEKVLNSEGLISVTEIAADLGLSALRLNKWLFEQGLQFKVNGSWVPAAKIKDKDFMRSRTYTFTDHTGVLKSNLLYYWTERGRRYVMELYRKLNLNK